MYFRSLVCILMSFSSLNSYASDISLEMFKLIQNCDSEIKTNTIDGSCLLLGIKAHKNQNSQLFSKIEKLCIDVMSVELFENYHIYEDFLVYFPKCNYIVLSKLKSKKNKIFDKDVEFKELVRFLNSH